jgi:hypothetical protein
MHNPYSEATAVEEGMRREGEYLQSQKSWEQMCLDAKERELLRLQKELATARRVASTIPQLEAMVAMQAKQAEEWATRYGL